MDDYLEEMHYSAKEAVVPKVGVLICGYYRESYPYSTFRSKGTRDWVLTYTIGGRGRYRQPGLELAAQPGDLVLLKPGALHHYSCYPDEPWEFVWAHFIPRPPWLEWLRWPEKGKGLFRVSVSEALVQERIQRAFLQCYQDSQASAGGFKEELALNALEQVILLASREVALVETENPLSSSVRTVVDYLAEHLEEQHTVSALAKRARLSPSRLSHLFKEETGDSLISFLLKIRLTRASRLLVLSGRRVKEVAGEVGFDSPFYFSRQFKKHFGMSPQDYVRKANALKA